MKIPATLGVVETNSVDYIKILFDALEKGSVVTPLRSTEDEQRKEIANVIDVISPEQAGGWLHRCLDLNKSDDIAHISFTSGTEGLPKAVFLARSALIDVVERVQSLMLMTEQAKEYVGVPVYHSFGYGRCRHVASVGGSVYIPEGGFDPREVSSMLASGDINALSLVPSLLRVFIHNPTMLGDERFQLRWLEIGSQAMDKSEKLAIRELFPNARIVQHYGLTEASRTTLLPIDSVDEFALDSVGKSYGDCAVCINDNGRICIKGPHVAVALVKDGELIDAADEDGWFETTDLGSLKEGYLYFSGRADNVVNCGGQKVATEKLELSMSLRLDSQLSIAVSRILHPIYGEGFLVSFTAIEYQDEIKAAALESLFELGIKAKNAITMNRVDVIPKTHTGKVQHKQLVKHHQSTIAENRHEHQLGQQTDQQKSIEAIFINVLGLSADEINGGLSLSEIGIDSIQSVQLSLKLEQYLGYLPGDWRQKSIAGLISLHRREPSESTVEKPSDKSGKAPPIWKGDSNANPSDMSFWELIKEDFVTHDREWFSQGFFALFVNRFGNWRMGIKTKLLRVPMTLLYRLLIRIAQVFCGIKLDYTVHVGRRVKLEHFGGMILGARSIGDDVIIRQNTTFGIRDMTDLSAKPMIENGVNIGAGVVIVGNITIGRHSVIGPNCVVTEDLPPFSIVSAAPPSVVNAVHTATDTY